MSEPVNPDPADDDGGQALPPLPDKLPDDEPPMEPNPYMGGGGAPV
jgi:hypothetical protein